MANYKKDEFISTTKKYLVDICLCNTYEEAEIVASGLWDANRNVLNISDDEEVKSF